MKNISIKLFTALSLSLLIASCGLEDLTNDFQVQVNPSFMSHTASVQVFDAADANAEIADLTITFSGVDADELYDVTGAKTIIVEKGIASFGLHPRSSPSNLNPVRVTMNISAPGYVKQSVSIEFTERKFQSYGINLINRANPPQGASVQTQNYTLTGGATSQTETFSMPATGGKAQDFEIELPAGTQFMDASGNVISGGSLSVDVVGYDANSSGAKNAAPQGESLKGISFPDGTVADAALFSAGLADVNMSVGGTEVKQFNQPIMMRQEIDPTDFNPETQMAYVAGDSIEIWSVSNSGDKLQYDGKAVILNMGGKLIVEFSLDHLSSVNTGNAYPNPSCSETTVNIISNKATPVWISYYARYSGSTVGPAKNTLVELDQGSNQFAISPAGTAVANATVIDVYESYCDLTSGSNKIGSYESSDCSFGDFNLTVPAGFTPISVDLAAICPQDPDTKIRPNFTVRYLTDEVGACWEVLGQVTGGMGTTTKLELGKSYNIRANYDGTQETGFFTVDQTLYQKVFTLEPSKCQ